MRALRLNALVLLAENRPKNDMMTLRTKTPYIYKNF